MIKKVLIVALLAVLAFGIWERDASRKLWSLASNAEVTQQIKDSVQNREFLPGPLRGSLDASNTTLTVSGTISASNQQRELHGLPSLRENQKLNKAAESKLQDMFSQQYFEHDSPQGITPADVIKKAGYQFLLVGENLALGNFKNDQLLVEAWMNSPGHRANILHGKFREIGVAVGKGMYEGREVWMAVQEFGVPMSTCPNPPEQLQSQISANRGQINAWQSELERRKAQLKTRKYSSEAEYNSAVDTYNDLARRTNALIDQTKRIVEQYNAQVQTFNTCLEQNV